MISERAQAVFAFNRHVVDCATCASERYVGPTKCSRARALIDAVMEARAPEGGPWFCGFCVGAVDAGGVCPYCDWIWIDLMTEPEARAYRAGWESETEAADDMREVSAVDALEAFRKKHGG